MTRLHISLLAAALCAGFAATTHAQGTGMQTIGAGIVLGEPTGISAKVWYTDTMAIDGAAAWSFRGDTNIHMHADLLWHDWRTLDEKAEMDHSFARLPLYYGIGARARLGDDDRLGMRLVIGTSLMLTRAPFDFFFEIAPIMDVVPSTDLDMNAGIGARFWF